MKKVEKRALMCLLLGLVLRGGLCFFIYEDWHDGSRHCLSYLVKNGKSFVFAIFNGGPQPVEWILPPLGDKLVWEKLLDSSDIFTAENLASGKKIKVPAWSVLLFDIK